MPENEIPRRCDIQRNTPAELAIRAAVDAVEVVGAHPLLTDAVVLLGQAQEKLADYVDATIDATEMDTTGLVTLVRRLGSEGGTIVSSGVCSTAEIATARACRRFWVDPETYYGYVLRPKPSEPRE